MPQLSLYSRELVTLITYVTSSSDATLASLLSRVHKRQFEISAEASRRASIHPRPNHKVFNGSLDCRKPTPLTRTGIGEEIGQYRLPVAKMGDPYGCISQYHHAERRRGMSESLGCVPRRVASRLPASRATRASSPALTRAVFS
jgi:hypothetical protein